MNKFKRGQLLRERFKATCGVPYVKTGARSRFVVLPKPTGRGFVSCGPALRQERPAWVESPDPKPTVAPRTKRAQGASALTRIAGHFPAKLPRP